MMRYFKEYKKDGATAFEITKEEARQTLEGYWKKEALDDIFNNEKAFSLFTPFSYVWTKTDDGLVPMFFGIAE